MTDKKNAAVIIGAAAALLLGAGIWASVQQPINKASSEIEETKVEIASIDTVKEELMNSSGGKIQVDADVGDGSSTISEMKKKSVLVVSGTAISQEQYRPISVTTTFKVDDVKKGAIPENEIRILQLGSVGDGGTMLQPGNEYVLFLGHQESNIYYVIGGSQGIFDRSKSGEISSKDSIMSEDFEKQFKSAKNKTEAFEKWAAE